MTPEKPPGTLHLHRYRKEISERYGLEMRWQECRTIPCNACDDYEHATYVPIAALEAEREKFKRLESCSECEEIRAEERERCARLDGRLEAEQIDNVALRDHRDALAARVKELEERNADLADSLQKDDAAASAEAALKKGKEEL